MRDAHKVVVHHVCKVVGGKPVAFHQHLVVQIRVRHRDVAEYLVAEGRRPALGYPLADDEGLSGFGALIGLLRAERTAGIRFFLKGAFFLTLGLAAEATVSVAPFHQEFRVFSVYAAALGLNVGAGGAAHIGPLVMLKAALCERFVYDVDGALDKALLVGVLDAEDEFSATPPGDEVCVKCRPQITDVHVARGARGETRPHLAARYFCLHGLEISAFRHSYPSFAMYFRACARKALKYKRAPPEAAHAR